MLYYGVDTQRVLDCYYHDQVVMRPWTSRGVLRLLPCYVQCNRRNVVDQQAGLG